MQECATVARNDFGGVLTVQGSIRQTGALSGKNASRYVIGDFTFVRPQVRPAEVASQ